MPRRARTRTRFIALVMAIALAGWSCATPPAPTPPPPPFAEADIFLVPLGDVGPNDLNELAAHYRRLLGVGVVVGPAVPVDQTLYDPFRRQYIAEELVTRLRQQSIGFVGQRKVPVIAITHEPMFSDSNKLPYTLAFRGGSRFAVVSSAYMDTTPFGRESTAERVAERARKTVDKTIGILYYDLPLSHDPSSVLYGGIFRAEDLDQVDESSLERAIDTKKAATTR